MDNKQDFITRGWRAGIARCGTARCLGAAMSLGLMLVASEARAGVPLPVLAAAASEPSLAAVVKQIAPSVVGIETTSHVAAAAGAQSGRQARNGTDRLAPAASREIHMAGSGVVFDARRGLIITNRHLIDQVDRIAVKLTDGRTLAAERVGADPNTDVAVIKVEAVGLTELSFADSDDLEVGDFVLAVGNPLPLGQTVTAGIVSGLHRANLGISPYEDFIQTDAAIYPGNSGGALVNLHGHLVGINIAFLGAAVGNPASGFAIPANLVHSLAQRITENGDIHRGSLGVAFDDPAARPVRDLKVAILPPGAVILEVDAGSAAAHAGFEPGDLVTRVGGAPVRDAADLQRRIALLQAGETAEFAVSRRGSRLTVRAATAERGVPRQ
jgi:S1-C subfamily serine protease